MVLRMLWETQGKFSYFERLSTTRNLSILRAEGQTLVNISSKYIGTNLKEWVVNPYGL